LKLIFFSIFTIISICLSAQNDSYYEKPVLRYEDYIYQEGIKTIRFHPSDDPLAMPMIRLFSAERLLLSFDDLYEDFVNYSYTVIHCDANWKASGLMKSDYLNNFQNYYINDYDYSLNALVPYTNYKLSIPNQDLSFTKSGNYILKVYRDDNEENIVFTRRFMVYESMVSASGTIRRATQVDKMNSHQEVDFIINHSGYVIQQPFRDLNVVLLQNQRWDNAISNLKPQFIQNAKLTYNYDDENTFEGLNEFRSFDTKNLQTLSQNIRRINMDSLYHAYIRAEAPRLISKYAVQFDINGQYVVRRLDAGDSDLEADYVDVNFLLAHPQPYEEGDVYLFGKFSDWKLLPEYKLSYDYARGAYIGNFKLKQGFYNYSYAIGVDSGKIDLETVEGSHWETENDYQILIYNREVGSRYDRLIGIGELSSEDLY
tara:strand:- start:383 stop:1666 length:1284 start_codon:yes stop_codon:yes gene_type:complete